MPISMLKPPIGVFNDLEKYKGAGEELSLITNDPPEKNRGRN